MSVCTKHISIGAGNGAKGFTCSPFQSKTNYVLLLVLLALMSLVNAMHNSGKKRLGEHNHCVAPL